MAKVLTGIYRFLPIQLLLLHLRKYQLLLLFWVILVLTITGDFAAHFGASLLFLAPEYLGSISALSMFLLGCCMSIFVMAWNITTFIIHSHRIPFLGATRQAFLKYCINNSIIPLTFLIFFSVVSIRFQWHHEHTEIAKIVRLQLSFYFGFIFLILISFLYFFRVDRDLFKTVLSSITNPSLIREIIPYDSLDVEFDIIRADTYLSETLRVQRIRDLESYHPRLLQAVLRRHHRNAITATILALALLVLLGAFMENPRLRIPAGGGFLILFAVLMGLVGSVKYFLKTWELMGWVFIGALLSLLVRYKIFDLRSIAYGLDYNVENIHKPSYNYESLKKVFTPERYQRDSLAGINRLNAWLSGKENHAKPPLVIITSSGGGSRSAYWTFRSLQYIDSLSGGKLFKNTVLMTGASGGMLGSTYWRSLHTAALEGNVSDPYDPKYLKNIGKDLLNAIVFSLVSVDLISPFNKISIAGYSYAKDRGYAMEQELIRNTEGLLDRSIGEFKRLEESGLIPQLILNGTIINDGRRLMISSQPNAHLTQPAYAVRDSFLTPVDAVDFVNFFEDHHPYNLRLTTALRMNATFPLVLPVVKLPANPDINVMDAGLRDNYGMEVASRFLLVYKDWIKQHVGDVIFLEIRDNKEWEVFPPSQQKGIQSMISDPIFVIQNKWEPFQSYYHGYIKDLMPEVFDKIHFLNLTYIPQEEDQVAALNFHITQKEKQDIYQAIYHPQNRFAVQKILKLLAQPAPDSSELPH